MAKDKSTPWRPSNLPGYVQRLNEAGYLETVHVADAVTVDIETVQNSYGYAIDCVRASLRARLEGRVEGGDKVIMELVDKIVRNECHRYLNMPMEG